MSHHDNYPPCRSHEMILHTTRDRMICTRCGVRFASGCRTLPLGAKRILYKGCGG
jgi:hypothetical protein